MIKIHTCPINTRPPSSMRAALNSKYCMRAQTCLPARQVLARSLDNGEDHFSYQEGQHRVVSNKLHLPEEVKITKTKNGKHWITSSMEVEFAKDILEVRDGLGKVVDAMVLKPITHNNNYSKFG